MPSAQTYGNTNLTCVGAPGCEANPELGFAGVSLAIPGLVTLVTTSSWRSGPG
jgi:hypothetical protein